MSNCTFDEVFNAWRYALAMFGYTALYIERDGDYRIQVRTKQQAVECRISIEPHYGFDPDVVNRAMVDLVYKIQTESIRDRRNMVMNIDPTGRV